MLVRAGVALITMLAPAPVLAGSALPEGFVYLRDVDPTIVPVSYTHLTLPTNREV